ncbi:MAG: DUF1565 domain-containing protein [Polyangiaceae bacterium]
MSKSTLPIAATVFVAAGASVWLACGSSTFSSGGDAGSQNVPPNCDARADPKDSPACVDDSIGLFVSPSGDDGNTGTKESPVQTIGRAVTKADNQHDRVYVCSGTYAETVKLTGPISIYGGYSCSDWSYAGTAGGTGPKVVPSDTGYALDLEGVGAPATIEDLELDAQSGKNPGDSSIAVFISKSSGPITLRRVIAVAGDGSTGADAVVTMNYDGGEFLKGNAGVGDVGGAAHDCTSMCLNGLGSIGGKGGDANSPGGNGGPPLPPAPAGDDGAGGSGGSCNPHIGASGAIGDAGAPGAAIAGTLAASGWTASVGDTGETGQAAQGGGGGQGAATGSSDRGGGGGGCGGCGGAGGAGGGSGGSTFAVLVFQSSVSLDTCILQVGNGAAGAMGGLAQSGEVPDALTAGNPAGFLGCAG